MGGLWWVRTPQHALRMFRLCAEALNQPVSGSVNKHHQTPSRTPASDSHTMGNRQQKAQLGWPNTKENVEDVFVSEDFQIDLTSSWEREAAQVIHPAKLTQLVFGQQSQLFRRCLARHSQETFFWRMLSKGKRNIILETSYWWFMFLGNVTNLHIPPQPLNPQPVCLCVWSPRKKGLYSVQEKKLFNKCVNAMKAISSFCLFPLQFAPSGSPNCSL